LLLATVQRAGSPKIGPNATAPPDLRLSFFLHIDHGIIRALIKKLGHHMSTKETVAILGGTGDLGTGLAIRWSKAGYKIVIGSRTQEKADEAVAALKELSPDTPA
jgi:alpha-D-ribose 1-methylphosphonate 5-triphosphate synthase subunit PhnL